MLALNNQLQFMEVSQMAQTLIPSEIIKLGNEINKLKQEGQNIYNMTIGDYDPVIFPIPNLLKSFIAKAYTEGHTNYPPAHGVRELRIAISQLLEKNLNLNYDPENILVSGGSRPLIYAIYKTILDPGDHVIYPVPSWNNNHYCHLSQAIPIELQVGAEKNFMPEIEDIIPHLRKAQLLALCSPQNPTGTMFTEDQLKQICIAVLNENRRRNGKEKPLYIMYDQIYWQLCFGTTQHVDPVSLEPELKNYVIYVDGVSKSLAATGVRVGWAFGPESIISRMRAILSHVGAWAPKAEQVALAWFLNDTSELNAFISEMKHKLKVRLYGIYHELLSLKMKGYPVEVIEPQGAIYLTIKFPWVGLKTQNKFFSSQNDVTQFILNSCEWALVPFSAFGAKNTSEWYRLSVGTVNADEIPLMIDKLKNGMDQLIKN